MLRYQEEHCGLFGEGNHLIYRSFPKSEKIRAEKDRLAYVNPVPQDLKCYKQKTVSSAYR